MKNLILLLALLQIVLTAAAQDPKSLLQTAYDKCQSLQSGYYEMTRMSKSMTDKDTSKSIFHCYFKKLPDDKIFPSAFHLLYFYQDKPSGGAIYTGDDMATYRAKDSTATITSKSKWSEHLSNISHNYQLYAPLTNGGDNDIPHGKDLLDKEYNFTLAGDEVLNGHDVHHIIRTYEGKETKDDIDVIRSENHYWIRTIDNIPVQYTTTLDISMNNDTMVQYELLSLKDYQVKDFSNDPILTLSSIPSHYTISDYVPYKREELLGEMTEAPGWTFSTLDDRTLSLSDLKGKVVLLDFFYKSCYPCMQALPVLESLHKKYNAAGLTVVGIDPYDNKEDDLPQFLAKRGVTYDVVYADKEFPKSYNVSGYPTIYLIDKEGKIIHSHSGFSSNMEKDLEKIIKKHLD